MDSYISKEISTKISDLYSKKKSDEEFEFIINPGKFKFLQYFRVLNYLKYRSVFDKLKISILNTLDVNVSLVDEKKNIKNIRATIEGNDNINNLLFSKLSKNQDNIYIINNIFRTKHEAISFIVKNKKLENIVDEKEFNFRVRLSQEVKTQPSVNLLDTISKENYKIVYRYKQRVSIELEESLSIDLTLIKQTDMPMKINNTHPRYELEIDYSGNSKKVLPKIYSECEKLLKVIEENKFILSLSEKTNILNYYFSIATNGKRENRLDARQPISLELKNVTKDLPNKYLVTDKADGNRYFLIIHDLSVYLISNNLNVLFTGIKIKDKKWNGTILDGEYLKIKKRFVFLCFDCLFSGQKDMRKEKDLLIRLFEADKLISECFTNKNHKGHEFDKLYKFPEKKNKESLMEYLENSIKSYMNSLNEDINKSEEFPLIRRKYFTQISGIDSGEIFRNASLLWKKYIYDSSVSCPYHLDGLIFQPQIQAYITQKKHQEYKFPDYKWKPREHNSIDFYIEIDKDDSGKHNIYYDNTTSSMEKNIPYKIVNLYVGKQDKLTKKVVPKLFLEKSKKHIAHLFLVNGETRDENGLVLQDKSIVEFTYKTDMLIPSQFRWVARNIRFDKTERLNSGIQEYGNYFTTAINVWDTMNNPLNIEDFDTLGEGRDLEIKTVGKSRTNVSNDSKYIIQKSTTGYYQNIVTLAMPMKRFHNFIKGNMISTYLDQTYFKGNISVLDLACGRGGDINKFYYSKISKYVGVDIDKNNLVNNIDGAITRYKSLLKKSRGPKMDFIHGNIGALFNVNDQIKSVGKMSQINENLINSLKNEKFDIINCQFALHYLLKDQLTWNNLLENINNHLKPGGFFLVTTFDGNKVDELFKNDNRRYDSTYIDEKGNVKNLFTIIKKYDKKNGEKYIGLGHAIDYTNILMFSEEVFYTEYLVDPEFLKKELKEKCNMKLVETDLFDNQYNAHKKYFETGATIDSEKHKKSNFSELSKFYDHSDSVNVASYKLTKLNRYYVFQKLDENVTGGLSEDNNFTTKNFKSQLFNKYFTNYYLSAPVTQYSKKYSFQVCIYDSLKKNKIINEKSMETFYGELVPDNKISNSYISELCKKFGINLAIVENNNDPLVFEVSPVAKTLVIIKDLDRTKKAEKNKKIYKYITANKKSLLNKDELHEDLQ